MATMFKMRQRAITPLAASAFAAGLFLYPKTTLHAEAPPEEQHLRKPIYDDLPPIHQPIKSTLPTTTTTTTTSPTPTARLAAQIRRARLFLHAQTSAAETHLNTTISTLLTHERTFTQTLASLAPPPSSPERVMPGAIYVLVAAMAGSIISRNRNIALRATVPAAVGIGAAWVVLPVTMRNVGDLVWRVEERVPVVAENHLRVRGAVGEGWRQVRVRGEVMRRWSEGLVGEGRGALEEWVRKGR